MSPDRCHRYTGRFLSGRPEVFLASFVAMQIITEPLRNLAPTRLGAECGIVLAALLGLVLGALGLVRAWRVQPM